MGKTRRAVEPRTFYLNETHELARDKKTGGGRPSHYEGINWASKAQRLSESLEVTVAKLRSSRDPIREQRYFFLAKPVPQLTKTSRDQRKAPDGTITEDTDYSGTHARVFGRLGIDLIEVTDDGDAIVHARPDRFEQLVARSGSLEDLGAREQNRWVTVDSFDTIPPQLRIDNGWLLGLKRGEVTDVVIELQPLLTRLEIEAVMRFIAELISQESSGQLKGTGTDFSGRQWLRGMISSKSLRAIARDVFSVQSLHPPLYSAATARKARRRSDVSPQQSHQVPDVIDHLPCVAVFDTGIPAGHAYLGPYRRGQFTAPNVTGGPGNHGAPVASRIVFGDRDFHGGLEGVDELVGSCRYLDVNIAGGMNTIHDKSVSEALSGVIGAFPDVRVYNFSFGATRPLSVCDPVERRERLLMVQDLDNFIFANDVVVVAAAGNSPVGVVPQQPYPNHIDDPNWELGHWASGFNTLVCGASVGRLSPGGLVGNIGWPSPFTRIGPGLCDCPVPGFSAPGGNWSPDYTFRPGLGVWVCNDSGMWEDRAGTSHAAPLLSRQAAFAFDLLQGHCQAGARPYGVTVKAFLALTANKPNDSEIPSGVLELRRRTLGRGEASSTRLRAPNRESAVLIWQGVLEGPSDTAFVQIPVPYDWWHQSTQPMLGIVFAYDVPTNEAVKNQWACRKLTARFRAGPGAKAMTSRRIRDNHRCYPVVERLYDLRRVPKDTTIEGDMWLLDLSYEEIADYYLGIDFTPQQRVAFAAELFDDSAEPLTPQPALQSLPVASTMIRLSIPPAVVRAPVVLKARV